MAKLPRETEPCLVEVRGQEIDIAKTLPFKMGAWNDLRAHGIDPLVMARQAKNESMTSEPLAKIAYHAVKRAAAMLGLMGVTDQELDETLEFSDCTRIATAVMKADSGQEVSRPTLIESSVLPNGGTGVLEISTTSPSPN